MKNNPVSNKILLKGSMPYDEAVSALEAVYNHDGYSKDMSWYMSLCIVSRFPYEKWDLIGLAKYPYIPPKWPLH